MSLDNAFRQESLQRAEMAVEVAVLKEQMRTLIVGHAEMKAENASQSRKLDEVLRRLAQADGGWKAVMWLGGAFGALSGVVVGWLAFFLKGHS